MIVVDFFGYLVYCNLYKEIEYMSFSSNFKNARVASGLSQEELSKKLHISRQSVSRYENGSAEPSIDMLNEISIILKVSIEALIGSPKEAQEYKEFNSLSKDDRKMLWYDFIDVLGKVSAVLIPALCNMCSTVGAGIATFSIIQLLSGRYNNYMLIMLLVGALLIFAAGIFFLVNYSLITSRKFNRWLRTEKNVIRTKKLMLM